MLVKLDDNKYLAIVKSSNLVIDGTSIFVIFGFMDVLYKHTIIGSLIIKSLNLMGKFKTYKKFFKYMNQNNQLYES